MKRNLTILALVATMSASAFAVNFGDTTNNQGGQGGAGGRGGDGGNAVAGAAAAASASSKSTAVAAQLQGQAQGQMQSAKTGDVSVNVAGDQTYRTAATAYAAPLAASNGTCMGSSSVGAQGTFGLSFGTTWTDDSCDLRYDAEALRAVGQPAAAVARLCMKPEIAEAMAAAGTPCKGAKVASAPAAAPVPAPLVSSSAYTGSDPIVIKRLGLAK